MTDLKDTLISIARTPEELGVMENINDPAPENWHPKPGGSWFKGVHRRDFGQFFDFEVKDHCGDQSVFIAHSQAAKYWAWDNFHESTDRHGENGWIVCNSVIGFICRAAEGDALVDKETADANEGRQEEWET